MSQDKFERRVHDRYNAPYRVVISSEEGARLSSLTDNLSGGGLYLADNHNLPLNQDLDLSLHLPDGGRTIRCLGKVVRKTQGSADSPPGYGVQLEFSDPDEAVAYLRRLNALRAGEIDTAPAQYPILVVEDNEVLAEIVANALPIFWKRHYVEGPYLDVDLAPSADVALTMMAQKRYFLIISDIFMPNLDGRKFITQIRQNPSTREIPILAISAGDVGDEVMELDADAYMDKPLRLKNLFDITHLLLAGTQSIVSDDSDPSQISPLQGALRGATDKDS